MTTTGTAPPKWNATCEGQKLLDSKFKSGELHQNSRPKDTWEQSEVFKKYKLATFRTHLHKMKTKYGGAIIPHVSGATDGTDQDDPYDTLPEEDSGPANVTPAKRKSGTDSESTNLMYSNNSPLNNYILSQWSHPQTGRNFIDGFILLPSGINTNRSYKINVSEDGSRLLVGLTWPRLMSNLESIMKIAKLSDDRVNDMHPLATGITASFKQLKVTVNDDVSQEHFIELPIVVQSNILFMKCVNAKDKSGIDSGTIVHLRVEGIADNFANMVRDSGKIASITL